MVPEKDQEVEVTSIITEVEVTSTITEVEEVPDNLKKYLNQHVKCVRIQHTSQINVPLIQQRDPKERNC